MKRIYYQGSFKLASDWPNMDKPTYCGGKPDCCSGQRCRVLIYSEAIASAMENGVEFADQERVMNICHNKYSNILIEEELKTGTVKEIMPFQYWQPKDGDNWPAPEGAEIVEQDNHIEGYIWKTSKVAVLKSESVKNSAHSYTEGMDIESGESVGKKEKVMGGEWYVCHDPRSGRSYVTNIRNLSDSELQSIADRLNQ